MPAGGEQDRDHEQAGTEAEPDPVALPARAPGERGAGRHADAPVAADGDPASAPACPAGRAASRASRIARRRPRRTGPRSRGSRPRRASRTALAGASTSRNSPISSRGAPSWRLAQASMKQKPSASATRPARRTPGAILRTLPQADAHGGGLRHAVRHHEAERRDLDRHRVGGELGRAEQSHAEHGGLEQAGLGKPRSRHRQAEAEQGGEPCPDRSARSGEAGGSAAGRDRAASPPAARGA